MVRRHWVRGHWRGGEKIAAGGAFLACFIIGGTGFWLYDSMRDWTYANAVWWLLLSLLALLVAASVGGAAWWTLRQWRRTLSGEDRTRRSRSASARATSTVHVNVTVAGDGVRVAKSASPRPRASGPAAPTE